MPMVRPMSGLAAIVQTWPLGDSIGVRQQYPTLCRDTLRYVLTTHLFGPSNNIAVIRCQTSGYGIFELDMRERLSIERQVAA